MVLRAVSTNGGGSSVTSINGLSGSITLAAGTNITLTPAGNTITIASSGGGSLPSGSPTNLQYNADGTNFGGLVSSSVDATKGFLGLNNGTPMASLHTSAIAPITVGQPTGSTAVISAGASSAQYSFGSGSKTYQIWSKGVENSVDYYSAAYDTAVFTEPSSSDYDPNTLGVFINYAENGYIASGNTFAYQIWAIYPNSELSLGTIQSAPQSDDASSNPFAIDISWGAPPAGSPPGGYLVLMVTGPNAGLYRTIFGTSFTDDNTSWGGISGFSSLTYGVTVSFAGAAGAFDYLVLNYSNNVYSLTGGATSITDPGGTSWTGGPPTVSPTSYEYPALRSDGTTELVHGSGAFGVFSSPPVVQQSGDIIAALVEYGWITSPYINGADVKYSNGQALLSALDILYPDSTTFVNGTTHIVSATSGLITGSSTGINSAGMGTLNQLKLIAGNMGSVDGVITYNNDRPQIYITAAGGNYQLFTYADVLNPAFGGTGASGVSQGDILYGVNSSVYGRLSKNTSSTRYLSNTGTSNNPAWAQINLANGVTGTLPVANGGTGTTSFTPAVCLFDHFADANNSSTSQTDLYSDTIAAGQLATNGDKLFADYGGIFSGAVSATQQLRAYFGGTLVFDSGALSIGASTPSWDLYLTIIRVSASVVRVIASLTTSSVALASTAQYTEVTGLTLANTQILKITGTAGGVSGASSQITSKLSTVSFEGHA